MMYVNRLKNISLSDSRLFTKRQVELLHSLDLFSVYDLIYYLPFRYDDRSKIESIDLSLNEKRPVSIIAEIKDIQWIFFNRRKHPKIIIHSGPFQASLTGFNRPYLAKQLEIGQKYWIHARFVYKYNEIQAASFDFEAYEENKTPVHFSAIFPVYRLTEGVTIKQTRSIIKRTLDKYLPEIEDELPEKLIAHHHLMNKKDALRQIHFPDLQANLKKAKLRLAFEDFFSIQLVVRMRRNVVIQVRKKFHYKNDSLLHSFIENLPFSLTKAQERSLIEITEDLKKQIPMHRLLQGDVGSGKTVVAFAAAVLTAENGGQVVFLAPTEVLAKQHFQKAQIYLKNLPVQTGFLSGGTQTPERNDVLAKLSNGTIKIIFGTHALLQKDVVFKNLRLVLIDEQHKFGVKQRLVLAQKAEHPDVLVMTATPIPRTLTLTLYGDLDVSVIDSYPEGRQKVRTYWVKNKELYDKMLSFIKKQIVQKHQAFFIYPLIEESEKLDLKNTQTMFQSLKKYFREFKLGLLHGRLNDDEKNIIMQSFSKHEIDILVSTTVIEVGIDVPNATVMVIENSERFGLSQLHQLRGRVGRGEFASSCFLVSKMIDDEVVSQRMHIMENENDGFKIAEEDLRMRGPGVIFGTRQSGLPDIKIKDFIYDEKLLLTARKDAESLLNHDPLLALPEHQGLQEGIVKGLPKEYLSSG